LPLRAAHVGEDLEEALTGHAVLVQYAARGGLRARCDHREQDVLDGDVFVFQALGLLLGGVQQLRQGARDVYLAGCRPWPADARASFEMLLDCGAQRSHVDLGAGQQARDQPLGLVQQREQQVLDVDFGMPVAQGLGLRVVQSLLRLLGQPVGVHVLTSR